MCEFKVGDEVVCIDPGEGYPVYGDTYVVTDVFSPVFRSTTGRFGLRLLHDPNPHPEGIGWSHSMFRKVQRRNIANWLSQSTDFEEPKKINQEEKA